MTGTKLKKPFTPEKEPKKKKGQPLVPNGGNDRVWTPDDLTKNIVDHFKPTGRILEPCRGQGAFTRAMPTAKWCEIDEEIDFLTTEGHWDWIVTNPPWSKITPFLKKAMEVSDNIVFLALLNAWFQKKRMQDMQEAGFGFKEILLLDTPKKPWPQTGFQLAAVHISKKHNNQVNFSHLKHP